MFVESNDKRHINMFHVVDFYLDKNKIIFITATGNNQRIVDEYDTEEEAKDKYDELVANYQQ